jgi:zinc transport system ATP-binding protein
MLAPGNILEVDRLSVHFDKVEVLKDLSFTVAKGTTLAVIGPNGAGKTVLFQALIGSGPSEGTIRWAPDARIGYVPQKLDIERDVPITGLDFLRAHANLKRSSEGEITRVIELAGISAEVIRSPFGTLSGGQLQRLLVAFALMGDPSVLMLDEPTAGVDEPGQRLLNELVRRLQQERGLTVLSISHELSVVFEYATNVLCLGRGTACFGVPRKVLTPELLSEVYGTHVDYHVHDH